MTSKQNKRFLFFDGSLDPKSKIGFGAFLFLDENQINQHEIEYLKSKIQIIKFNNTSSSALELQILISILNSEFFQEKLIVYSDSQTVVNLPSRRKKINERKKEGKKALNLDEYYQKFFKLLDQKQFQLIKIKGHKKKSEKNSLDLIFSLVDKASRASLRNFNKKIPPPIK